MSIISTWMTTISTKGEKSRPPKSGRMRRIAALGMRGPAAGEKQHAASARPVFVAVLGVDRRACRKVEASAGNRELDVSRGDQMHFDARQYVVPPCLVTEGVDRHVAVELAVDPLEQVEVELGGDSLGLVIGGDQPLDRPHAVRADQQLGAGPEQRAGRAQAITRAP